jgi:cephalosporin hydroxylase
MKISNRGKLFQKFNQLLGRSTRDEYVSFNSRSIYYGHQKITYKGVQAIRCPFDFVMFQMIVFEVKPDLIIEIGSNEGGSALYLADLMQSFGLSGEIHSIDINDSAVKNLKNNPNIKVFTNGWEAYDLEHCKGFNKILVIEDAAHTYECTIGAIKKFAPVVSKDSYLIVEDGIVDVLGTSESFNGGPLKALREFLPNHPEFIVERKWCDMFGKNATFNVNGYLKKIK